MMLGDNDERRVHYQQALEDRLSLLAVMQSHMKSALRSFDPIDDSDAYHALFGDFVSVHQLQRQVLKALELTQGGPSLDDVAKAMAEVDAKMKGRFPHACSLHETPVESDPHGHVKGADRGRRVAE